MDKTLDTEWTLESVMTALHRVNREWPNRDDVEFYANRHPRLFPYASTEEAEAAIAQHHAQEVEEDRIREIGRITRYRAITGFAEKYMHGEGDYSKGRVRESIDSLLAEEDFVRLEEFLTAVVNHGNTKALQDLQKQSRGSTFGHIAAGVFALVEIFVLSVALAVCQRGFQTIVVSGLGIIYSVLSYYTSVRSHGAATQFLAVAGETTRIRKLLKDRAMRWDVALVQHAGIRDELAKGTVRLYINIGKLALIELICVVAIIYTSL